MGFYQNFSELCQTAPQQNNKGGIKPKKCNEIAKEIWLWCFKNNTFISAAHIPEKHNIEADQFSRKSNNNTDWQLNPPKITNKFNFNTE